MDHTDTMKVTAIKVAVITHWTYSGKFLLNKVSGVIRPAMRMSVSWTRVAVATSRATRYFESATRTQQPQPQPSTKYDSPNTHTPSKYPISSNKNQINRRPKKLRPRLPPFALNNASKRPSQEVALLSLPPFTLSTRTMPTRPCRPLLQTLLRWR